MKKLKLPKVNIKKVGAKNTLSYLSSVLISSIILALVLISLPLTERVTSSATYDLVNKSNMYWAKEYILELDTTESKNIKNDIEKTRSVIQKRLSAFAIEQSSIQIFEKEDKSYLRVSVQTSKSKELVENLIKSPFVINIVTRKDDVNYEDQENPLTPYLEENYNSTEFTRKNFRNVYLTRLKNSANEYSYFALFKIWPWEKEWQNFLDENLNQSVGVSIDGFVTPVQVTADQGLFAVPVSATEKDLAHITSILYNSGVVPLSYSVTTEEDISIENAEIDYIKLTEGILVAIIFIYIYLLFIEKTPKDILLRSGISSLITVASWIAYLKISGIPIDIFLLAMEVITIIAVIRIITENVESRMIVTVLIALISSLCMLLGSGYVKLFANDLLILMILSNLSLSISTFYLLNVRNSLKL